MIVTARVLASLLVCGALLAGCSPTQPTGPNPQVFRESKGTTIPASVYALNLGNENAGAVMVYKPGGTTPIRILSKGINRAAAMAFDSAGNLYVITGSKTVVVFPPGSTDPSETIAPYSNQHVRQRPINIAIDGSDNVYLLAFADLHSNVMILAPDHKTVLAAFQVPGEDAYFALDSQRNVYISGSTRNKIYVYAPLGASLLRSIPAKVPQYLWIDRSDNVYVAQGTQYLNRVSIFAAGSAKLLRTLTQGMNGPTSVITDNAGRVYVGNSGWVSVFNPNSSQLSRKILTPSGYTNGFGFDRAGHLYTIGGNRMFVISAPSGPVTTTITQGLYSGAQVNARPAQ